jgi:hypothetical protein
VHFDFRITYYKISRGLQPITLSESAAARKVKAMALPFVDAKDMVTEVFQDKKVLAFANILFQVLIVDVWSSLSLSNYCYNYSVLLYCSF